MPRWPASMLTCSALRLLDSTYSSRPFHRPAPQWEHAQCSFQIDADLRPVWNWNTQQLFVYVAAEWEVEGKVR